MQKIEKQNQICQHRKPLDVRKQLTTVLILQMNFHQFLQMGDVIFTRSGLLDTCHRIWRMPLLERIDVTRITLISQRLVQQETQREALTKCLQNAKNPFIKNEFNTYSVSKVQLKRHQFYLIKRKMKNRNKKNYLIWPSNQFGPK